MYQICLHNQFLNIDCTDKIKSKKYIIFRKNSSFFRIFSEWIKTEVYSWSQSENSYIIDVLKNEYGYNGNYETHKQSFGNFIDEYLPNIYFYISSIDENNIIYLTPTKISDSNKIYRTEHNYIYEI